MDAKTLNKKIVDLGKKTEGWRKDVQLALVGCAYQAIEGDSNIDPCTRIVGVLKGSDVAAVIHWLENHVPVIWMRSEGKFRMNKAQVGKMAYDAVTLMSEPWYEKAIKPQNVSSSVDFMEQLQGFIKRMEREVTKGGKTIAHAEVLYELKAVSGKLAQAAIE